jgi:hypothetical protein
LATAAVVIEAAPSARPAARAIKVLRDILVLLDFAVFTGRASTRPYCGGVWSNGILAVAWTQY